MNEHILQLLDLILRLDQGLLNRLWTMRRNLVNTGRETLTYEDLTGDPEIIDANVFPDLVMEFAEDQDRENKLLLFLQDMSEGQFEWLQIVQQEDWSPVDCNSKAAHIFNLAKFHDIRQSVAYIIVVTTMVKAGFEVPAKLAKIAYATYKPKTI